MKKQQKLLILAVIIIVIVSGLIFYFWQRPQNYARDQVSAYKQYEFLEQEAAKVKRNEKDFLYYYAADGKRYVFPDNSVFKSWFNDYPIEDLTFEDVDTMSESPLGGNVSLRPGSLLQSPTLLDTFIVISNGGISPVSDETLLTEFYGSGWKDMVIVLPDYYFSQYNIGKPIKNAADFPQISAQLTIEQDLNSK